MAEDMFSAAKSMLPKIRENLSRIDSECQLPADLAEAMAEKGPFGLDVPHVLSGPE